MCNVIDDVIGVSFEQLIVIIVPLTNLRFSSEKQNNNIVNNGMINEKWPEHQQFLEGVSFFFSSKTHRDSIRKRNCDVRYVQDHHQTLSIRMFTSYSVIRITSVRSSLSHTVC